jgi:peptide/nickel transport system permease protein
LWPSSALAVRAVFRVATVGGTWDEPSASMWLGADQIGRDMLTRMIYGARMTIGVALATTTLSFLIGITLGFAAARCSAAGSTPSSHRLVDVMLSIPRPDPRADHPGCVRLVIPVLILTIAVLDSTRVFRLSRALGMNLTVLEYVEAARLRGEGPGGSSAARSCPMPRRRWCPSSACALLQLPVHCRPVLPGAGHPAAVCRLGGMVRENSAAINFGMMAPIWPGHRDHTADGRSVNMVVDWMLSVDARPSGAQAEL